MIRIPADGDLEFYKIADCTETFIGLLFKGLFVYALYEESYTYNYKWLRHDYFEAFPEEFEYIKQNYPEALL